jgi:hypothetical protein
MSEREKLPGTRVHSTARINDLLLFDQKPSGICPVRPKSDPKIWSENVFGLMSFIPISYIVSSPKESI